MRIYNTMSRRPEEFVPIEPGKVRMYVCGPTVYNLIHIGNARPMIFFDTVRRYFLYRGYAVHFVSNFTDVDDKIIKAAQEEGEDAAVISERYIAECKKDMAALNVMDADVHPQATREIDGMVEMIGGLIDKGHAYPAMDGTVYFRSRSFAGYGKLSHKQLDDLRAGERALQVDGAAQKEDVLDFVLWKPKKEGEPYWTSPWCEGRPGWHIECSVMSRKYLGDEIDIHGGGEDLVFPHHENEIAQSESFTGKPFARYWMHNAFLNIDNRKMSKSLGNFFTVRDVLEKYDGQVLRFFMLSAHYRSPLNFSAALMESAKASLQRILNCVSNLDYLLSGKRVTALTDGEEALLREAARFEEMFCTAMDDDFNTADALSAVFELVRFVNTHAGEASSAPFLTALREKTAALLDVLGIRAAADTGARQEGGAIADAAVEALIAKRTAAKKEKNYALADEIRAQLLAQGIVLEDTREGVRWKRQA